MDDKQLLLNITNNDQRAFSQLISRYYTPLCLFCGQIVGDDSTAEDIVQDVFVDVWEKRRRLAGVEHIRNYLYIMGRNRSISHRRSPAEGRLPSSDTPGEHTDISLNYIEQETRRILEVSVGQLPIRTQQVIKLGLQGLRQDEIAREMGIALATVKSLKADAIKKLKKMMVSK